MQMEREKFWLKSDRLGGGQERGKEAEGANKGERRAEGDKNQDSELWFA